MKFEIVVNCKPPEAVVKFLESLFHLATDVLETLGVESKNISGAVYLTKEEEHG